MVVKIDLKKVALWISLAAIELMIVIIAQYGNSMAPGPSAAMTMDRAAYNVVVSAVDQVSKDIESGGLTSVEDARNALSYNLGGTVNTYTEPILAIVNHPETVEGFRDAMKELVKHIKVTE